MVVTARTFEQLALEEPDRQWELHDGQLREKPPMTAPHNRLAWRLAMQVGSQLNPAVFEGRLNASWLRRSPESYFIPDFVVLPVSLVQAMLTTPTSPEVYRSPVPLVVEIWSPSTGGFDVNTKLAEYQARGDLEIWRLHPYERTLTDWRRQPDGSYLETVYRGGIVPVISLPNVAIDLDALFG